jgi:hypothetical protein
MTGPAVPPDAHRHAYAPLDTDWPKAPETARNFLRVLNLIDRTILPRRIVISNGVSELVLHVARRRWLATPAVADVQARKLMEFCAMSKAISHRIEALPKADPGSGLAAADLAEAALRTSPSAPTADSEAYAFSSEGWPVAKPSSASPETLLKAWMLADALTHWHARHQSALSSPALLVAVAPDSHGEMTIELGCGLTASATAAQGLGQLIARLRSRDRDKPTD